MAVETQMVSLDNPDYRAAVETQVMSVMASSARTGDYGYAFQAAILVLSMLVERQPLNTPKALREHTEVLGKVILNQVKVMRAQREAGEMTLLEQIMEELAERARNESGKTVQ